MEGGSITERARANVCLMQIASSGVTLYTVNWLVVKLINRAPVMTCQEKGSDIFFYQAGFYVAIQLNL